MTSLSNFVSESIISEGRFSNYYDDDTPEGKLAAYIYDASVGYLSPDTLSSLLDLYPNQDKSLAFRGLFFDSIDSYKKFLDSIKNNRIDLGGYSSWTRDQTTAQQFALTKPTNNIMFLGKEFFQGEDHRRKIKDYTQGYGVILETVIKQKAAVDISTIQHIGQEDELILPKGSYVVKIRQTFKPHKDGIKDIEDINLYVQKQRKIKSDYGRAMEYSMLEHILANYEEQLTDKSRKHLFNMFSGGLDKMEWKYSDGGRFGSYEKIFKIGSKSNKYDRNIDPEEFLTGKDQSKIELRLKGFNLNLLMYSSLFLKEDKKKFKDLLNSQGKELIKILQSLKADNSKEYFFNFHPPIIDAMDKPISDKIRTLSNDTVGSFYNKMNSREEINKINKLTGQDQRQAIQDTMDNMLKLFKNIN